MAKERQCTDEAPQNFETAALANPAGQANKTSRTQFSFKLKENVCISYLGTISCQFKRGHRMSPGGGVFFPPTFRLDHSLAC